MSAAEETFNMRDDLAVWLRGEIESDGRVRVDATDEGDRFYGDLAEGLMTAWLVLRK